MNIYSGSGGLGSALTNPTELARHKGKLDRSYGILFNGRAYPDAETAYQRRKTGDVESDDNLMAEIIRTKLMQYPELLTEINNRGGLEFLRNCVHFTGARTSRFKSWEGRGEESRFIRNLIEGYIRATL